MCNWTATLCHTKSLILNYNPAHQLTSTLPSASACLRGDDVTGLDTFVCVTCGNQQHRQCIAGSLSVIGGGFHPAGYRCNLCDPDLRANVKTIACVIQIHVLPAYCNLPSQRYTPHQNLQCPQLVWQEYPRYMPPRSSG